MVIDIKKVASLLKGTSRISDVRSPNDLVTVFRFDEKNPDFVRNRFHVLGNVFYYENTRDWRGNINQGVSIILAFASYNSQYESSRQKPKQWKDDKIRDLLVNSGQFPKGPLYVSVGTRALNAFKWYFPSGQSGYLYTVSLKLSYEHDPNFQIKSEEEIVSYVKKAIALLFNQNNYDFMMEYMFELDRMYDILPETGNSL